MMKLRPNKKMKIFLVFIIVFYCFNFVFAANIGISPAKISFEDVLRNGYAERNVLISIDSEDPIDVSIKPRGEISEWLNFSATNFKVSKNNPYSLVISVEPPEDIPNGNYSGFLRVETSGEGEVLEGQATGVVKAALDLYIQVEITDLEIVKCKASNFKVESAEEGDNVVFSVDVLNQGNVKLSPKIDLEVWDENQIEVVYSDEFSGSPINPTVQGKVEFEVDSDNFDLGQYWSEVSAIDCYVSETLTFDVLKEGALKAQGTLSEIVTVPWVETKDTTLIEAFFENTGEKNVNAQFKGEIISGNKIVQILESEASDVEIGDENVFKFYFTPQNPGKYIVSGRVFYDGKRTYEKSAIINVKSSGIDFRKFGKTSAYIVLIGIIAFMVHRIRKEKTNYRKKYGDLGR